MMDMVGGLEQQVAQRMGPSVTARFGHRLGGWSGVTLPGSGANIRVPSGLQRGGSSGNGERSLIGSRRLQRKGIYW